MCIHLLFSPLWYILRESVGSIFNFFVTYLFCFQVSPMSLLCIFTIFSYPFLLQTLVQSEYSLSLSSPAAHLQIPSSAHIQPSFLSSLLDRCLSFPSDSWLGCFLSLSLALCLSLLGVSLVLTSRLPCNCNVELKTLLPVPGGKLYCWLEMKELFLLLFTCLLLMSLLLGPPQLTRHLLDITEFGFFHLGKRKQRKWENVTGILSSNCLIPGRFINNKSIFVAAESFKTVLRSDWRSLPSVQAVYFFNQLWYLCDCSHYRLNETCISLNWSEDQSKMSLSGQQYKIKKWAFMVSLWSCCASIQRRVWMQSWTQEWWDRDTHRAWLKSHQRKLWRLLSYSNISVGWNWMWSH